MTTRTRTAVLGLVLATGLTATVTSASAVGLPAPYSQNDDTGDVKVTKKKGLPDRQRRSIDLASVQAVQDEANREVRILAGLRRVTDGARFDQVVTLYFGGPSGEGGVVTFSPSPGERRSGLAVYDDEGPVRTCRDLRTEIGESRVVSVVVPYRCIPDVPVSVEAASSTEVFGEGGEPWSFDAVPSEGTYQLRPAAQ